MSSSLKALQAAVDRVRTSGGRLRSADRAEVARLIEQAHAAGASYGAIASAVQVGAQTLRRWRGGRSSTALAVVRVIDAPRAAGALTVYGPRGLRIEGLSVDGLAALLERLSS